MINNSTQMLPAMVLACVPLIASCSNSEEPQQVKAPENNIDPCSYLTSADIESVLGWKVATTEPKAYGPTGTCTYKSATPYSAEGMQVLSLTIAKGMPGIDTSGAMVAWRQKQYENHKEMAEKVIIESLDGLGVPAIVNGMKGTLGLEMNIGNKLITASLVDSPATAKSLGERILAHTGR